MPIRHGRFYDDIKVIVVTVIGHRRISGYLIACNFGELFKYHSQSEDSK